ncbi:MAG TPA: hypothetical protein VIY51_28250 [Xanthobacteraceae bacterium]
MTHRIAIIAAIAVMATGLPLLQGRDARAQDAPQSLQPSAPPAEPAVTPPARKSHGGSHPAASGNVMRGGDTISLIATLPWWRVAESRQPDPGQLESPILTACDVWLGFPFATADARSLTVRLAAAQHAGEIDQVANRITVVDAGELNEIDLTAPEEPQNPSHPWLSVLLALLGGAVAAFSAARYLTA